MARNFAAMAVSVTAATQLFICTSGASLAQQRETKTVMPVARDLPRSFSIPGSAVTNILDMDVGMKSDEAVAVLSRLVNKPRCCGGANQFISHDQGNVRVSTTYHQRSQEYFEQDGIGNNVTIVFTPALIGSRVVAISRSADLSKRNVPISEVEAAVLGKYGPPSLKFRQRDTLNFVWAYGASGKVDLSQAPQDQLARLTNGRLYDSDPVTMQCVASIERVDAHYGGASYSSEDVRDNFPGCNVVLMISVLSSSIEGRADRARYLHVDYRRRYEERRAVKEFLDAQMSKALAAEPRTPLRQ